jgi:Methyltransferase domain
MESVSLRHVHNFLHRRGYSALGGSPLTTGGVAERTNAAVLKTVDHREVVRGFESLPLRLTEYVCAVLAAVVGRRSASIISPMSVERQDDRAADDYRRLVGELAALERVPIGTLVTREHVLDLLILYESLAQAWSLFPFELHAFVMEDDVERMLTGLEIGNLRVHRLPGTPADWTPAATKQAALVEHAGLERCLVSDVMNVFLTETPELLLLVSEHDLVFVGAPSGDLVGTHLWSFRRNQPAIAFAREWEVADGASPNASGLRAALARSREVDANVKVVAPPAPEAAQWPGSPYAQGPDTPTYGRAKVIHLGLIPPDARSAKDRVRAIVDRYPGSARFLPMYATLADSAARRLGAEGIDNPAGFVRACMIEAGQLAQRNELPLLLNARGLLGTAVEVGVKQGRFSEHILEQWEGERLISIDPWKAAPSGEYVDVSNVDQETHDIFYERTLARLSRFGDRSEVWRLTSQEASARIDRHSLDFVYIDARHDYEWVKEDLGLWFDKVRPGGIVAGHDYLDDDRPQGRFRVKSAVDEFFGPRGLQVRVTAKDGRWPSWYVEIPARQ